MITPPENSEQDATDSAAVHPDGDGAVRPDADVALLALDRLLSAIDEVEDHFDRIRERADVIKHIRQAGRPYRDIVPMERQPLVVQLLSTIHDRLSVAGSDWRREEARALHREGVSMEQIATLFGVSRQRVSALLSSRQSPPPQ